MTNQYINPLTTSVIDHQRRRILQAVLATPALFLSPQSDALVPGLMMELTRLQPSRFFAGLILNLLQAVLVEVVAKYIVGQWKDGPVSFYSSLPLNEDNNFNHVGYKVAVLRLGVVDYEEHKRRMLALQLKNIAQTQRFLALKNYLRDEHIRVCLAGDDYAKTFPINLDPDDLFSMNYLEIPNERVPIHYSNLLNVSGTQVFEQWYG